MEKKYAVTNETGYRKVSNKRCYQYHSYEFLIFATGNMYVYIFIVIESNK